MAAVEAGFRHLDCAERYRNEAEVGAALKDLFAGGAVRREDLFVTTKLWNNNHRPERVKPALQASLRKLGLDSVDLYLVHTPFAFQPGDDQDPRDPHGAVVYDDGVTLEETWAAMEGLVDEGLSRAIGLSDIDVEGTRRDRRHRQDQARGRGGRVASVSPAMGAAPTVRDRGHRPAGLRPAGACAGTATARRPADRLDGATAAARHRRRSCSPGASNAAPRCSRHRSRRPASPRMPTSQRFRTTWSGRSAPCRPGTASTPWSMRANRDSSRCRRAVEGDDPMTKRALHPPVLHSRWGRRPSDRPKGDRCGRSGAWRCASRRGGHLRAITMNRGAMNRQYQAMTRADSPLGTNMAKTLIAVQCRSFETSGAARAGIRSQQ